jgi:GT2 family glycosyltransferase
MSSHQRVEDTVRPLIAVILPTRNRAHCLPRAIDSVLRQDGRGKIFDVEIIVVDDASSDRTPELIRSYSEVRGIRFAENRGPAVARNEALRSSHADYVAFLDDDDEWLPNKLLAQLSELRAHPEVGVVYSPVHLRVNGEESLYPQKDAPSGWIFEKLLIGNCCGGSLLWRREAIDRAGEFDESLRSWSDYDLYLRVAPHFPFLFLPEPVASYSPSSDGVFFSAATQGHGLRDRIRVTEKALKKLPETADFESLRLEARASAELGTIWTLLQSGQIAQAWSQLVTTLLADPRILQFGWLQEMLREVIKQRILTGGTSWQAHRDLERQLSEFTDDRRMKGRTRRVFAEIWLAAASCWAEDPGVSRRVVAHAVVRALTYDPSVVWRQRLIRILPQTLGARRMMGSFRELAGRLASRQPGRRPPK